MKVDAPLIVLPLWGFSARGCCDVMAKGLSSSLLRSLYSGSILVFRSDFQPLFKVERAALTEVLWSQTNAPVSLIEAESLKITCVTNMLEKIKCQPRQWVAVVHSSSLSLRNIDHLFPTHSAGAYAHPEVDFLWARARIDEISNRSATPGIWAVRGEHLPLVLNRLLDILNRQAGDKSSNEEDIWTRVVQELPLRKRAFEKGEVVAPRMGAVDWEAVSNAAFVTVPRWEEKEAWKFLQALYFRTHLADETGMMLNIFEGKRSTEPLYLTAA